MRNAKKAYNALRLSDAARQAQQAALNKKLHDGSLATTLGGTRKHEHSHTKYGIDAIDTLLNEGALALTTRGDTVVMGATDLERLAIGAANTYLRSDGTDPEYGTILASHVGVLEVAGATYDDVQDYINLYGSKGLISGGDISDNGNGTVNVAAGTCWVKTADNDLADLVFMNFDAQANVSLTDATTNYVYVNYSGGSPTVASTTSVGALYDDRIAIIGIVYLDGSTAHYVHVGSLATNIANKVNLMNFERHGLSRAAGMVISATNRYVEVTAGVIYGGLLRIVAQSFDTDPGGAGDTFSTWYYDGNAGPAVWVETTGETQIDNARYNDIATGLDDLTAQRYAVHWVYVDFDGNQMHVVYGQGDYTASLAEAAAVPSLVPGLISNYCVLVGKIIIQDNASTMDTLSPFVTMFTSSLATDHGSLAGLGDDDHTQYIKDTDFDAHSMLMAVSDNTPIVLSVAEQRIVGRITGQNIQALTAAEIRTLINVADGADVTGDNAPQAHAPSHKWHGSDAQNIKDSWIAEMVGYYYFQWRNFDGWSNISSGTGAIDARYAYCELDTGIGENSEAAGDFINSFWHEHGNSFYHYRTSCRIDWRTVVTNSLAWIGFLTDPWLGVNDIDSHVAFKVINGRYWASNADGATQKLTDTGVDAAQWYGQDLYIKYMADNIKFYIDGVLVATHAENRPNNVSPLLLIYLKTTDTTKKELWVQPIQILRGEE